MRKSETERERETTGRYKKKRWRERIKKQRIRKRDR